MADLIGHLRNLLVAQADPAGIEEEEGAEAFAVLQAQAGQIPMDRLLDLIEQFAAAESRMKWAPNKRLHFEIAVIKAIQTLGSASLTEVLDTLTALKTGGELPPSRPAAPPPAPRRSLLEAVKTVPVAPAVPPPKVRADIVPEEPQEEPLKPDTGTISLFSEAQLPTVEEPPAQIPAALDTAALWTRVQAEVRQQKPFIIGWVQAGTLLSLENGVATIGFPETEAFAKASLDKTAQRQLLDAIFTQVAGQPVAVKLELRSDLTAAPAPPPEPEADPAEAFKNDPFIRAALDLFQAEIQVG